MKAYVDPFFDKRRKTLYIKLEELTRPYDSGYGLPPEKDFLDLMNGLFLRRLGEKLIDMLEMNHPGIFQKSGGQNPNRAEVLKTISNPTHVNKGQFGTDIIIPMMSTQYGMSKINRPKHI